MRVMQISKAKDDELYNKTGLDKVLNVSVRTIERYILDDEIEKNAIQIGKRKFYRGSDLNTKIDKLVQDEDKFVLLK
mgnify:FL=1